MPALLLAAPLAVLVAFALVSTGLLAALAGAVWLAEQLLALAERAARRWRWEARLAVRVAAVVERRVERAVAEEVAEVRAAVSGAAGAAAGPATEAE